VLAVLLFSAPTVYAAGPAVSADVDSVYLSGLTDSDDEAVHQAIQELEARLPSGPAGPVYNRIGLLYLHLKEKKKAREIFRKALAENDQDAVALAGLGRVELELEDDGKKAIPHFLAAVAADSTYVRGYVYLARAYAADGKRSRARKAAGNAIRLDPASADAYLVLGKTYEKDGNMKAASVYYKQFLEQGPADQTDAIAFATGLFKEKRYDLVQEMAPFLTEQKSFPLLAQLLVQRGDHEGALEAWRRYLEGLSPGERTYFDDIGIVALPREARAFNSTPPERREEYLRRFWMRKDPLKSTGGILRRVEHYRRVWFARTFFSEKEQPWDRRGEVYVRYGEPAYRSASHDINFRKSLEVQRVQEVMAHALYGDKGLQMTFLGPVWPIRTLVGAEVKSEKSEAAVNPDEEFGFRRHKPVTAGSDWTAVPWEVWVYTNIGSGMEFTFTDEFLSGRYEFAPIPSFTATDLQDIEAKTQRSYLRMVERLADYSSSHQFEELKYTKPEIYDLSNLEPLDFYYEVLTFRNANGKDTDVLVTVGIPVENLVMKGDGDTTVVVLTRTGLYTDRAAAIQSVRKDLSVPLIEGRGTKGQLAVDRIDMTAPPGEYLLPVQAWRRDTDLTGVYPQHVTLPNYAGPGLKVSDIQIARQIEEATEGADTTFVRRGFTIVPWPPTTFFPGEPLFIYMEVYNLNKGSFGRTHFEMGYEIRATGDASSAPQAPFMPMVLKRDGESVEVAYEQAGTESDVYEYWELNLGQVKPGSYTLKVNVKDLNSGEEQTREHDFRILERRR